MLNLSNGIIVSLLGMVGLAFAFIDKSLVITKVPIIIFFLMMIGLGIAYEMLPQHFKDETYGEFESGGGGIS